jgi:pimeloyl-ACP methyl ester carboxylesterase
MNEAEAVYGNGTLPGGIRSRILENINGLSMHVLEAGEATRPCVLLLHGFPELAFSWRKIMLPLADAGFHVVAPDQRGYGGTTGWDGDYDGDIDSFRMLNLVRDMLGLIASRGHQSVAAVVGHDFGSPVAANCALIRPDVFRKVVLMSAPYAGPPNLLARDLDPKTGFHPRSGSRTCFSGSRADPRSSPSRGAIFDDLERLDPPRKHYQRYYQSREANANMWHARHGLHAFLRGYYHFKSADWKANRPFRLAAFTPSELAKMPTYYVMDRDKGMAETVAAEMPSAAEIAACRWLTADELSVYAAEFDRTGFQGGLQWYRCTDSERQLTELEIFSGRTLDVPACFIAGKSDWGVYQFPGAFERMPDVCTQWCGAHLIEGAGHWVQQEQPEEVTRLLFGFLRE